MAKQTEVPIIQRYVMEGKERNKIHLISENYNEISTTFLRKLDSQQSIVGEPQLEGQPDEAMENGKKSK